MPKIQTQQCKPHTHNMWLVYRDSNGDNWYQPWHEVAESGGLIDSETDTDMELIGWTDDPR